MAESVRFTAANGVTVEGVIARPAGGGKAPGVVLVQEWWGVNDHIKSVVDRLAAEGFVVIAPDLYHGKSTRDPDEAAKLMNGLDFGGAVGEVGATAAHLAASSETNGKVAVMGFCMGGAITFLSACHVPGLSAAVAYYGLPPAQYADYSKVTAPVLAHVATRDDWVKVDAVQGVAGEIATAGKTTMRVEVYEADHAFSNDTRPDVYSADNAKLAWQRTVEFLKTNLG